MLSHSLRFLLPLSRRLKFALLLSRRLWLVLPLSRRLRSCCSGCSAGMCSCKSTDLGSCSGANIGLCSGAGVGSCSGAGMGLCSSVGSGCWAGVGSGSGCWACVDADLGHTNYPGLCYCPVLPTHSVLVALWWTVSVRDQNAVNKQNYLSDDINNKQKYRYKHNNQST